MKPAQTDSCVVCLLVVILSCLFSLSRSYCDRRTGPAGVTECFLGTPFYNDFQCGTCLTNAYIIQVGVRAVGYH